jgi:microcystin-dependent protein
MASTYSTNLRTELIGAGDQSGTWGTTTNITLGTILEQAVAGVSGGPYVSGTYPAVNFPSDADITLTANNGSIDQARSAVLVVTSTGSLTATRNVIAPASASKLYVINNSTSGGQSIQIKYASGAAVLIPNGQTYPVYGDGTNFYLASSNTTPTGTIQMWATASAPVGYVLCNGTAISRTTFSNLFSVIGTTFGVGDGSTTFNVPDYTNRMPYGATVGTTGGTTSITLGTTNLPNHTHTFSGTSGTMNSNNVHSHSINDPGHNHLFGGDDQIGSVGGYVAQSGLGYDAVSTGAGAGNNYYTRRMDNTNNPQDTGISINGVDINHTHGFSGTTGATGSGTAITTISPYLGINFIIKT